MLGLGGGAAAGLVTHISHSEMRFEVTALSGYGLGVGGGVGGHYYIWG